MMELSGPTSGEFFAENDLALNFAVTDDDGVAVNISGFSIVFIAQRRNFATAVLSTATSPATAVAAIVSGAGGTFTVTIADSDTVGLEGDYEFQCQIVDAGGLKSNIHHGVFTFKPNLITA